MPWFIYHALKQLFPSGRFFSFFAATSIVGVMLGVCVLLIVQSVMNGFGESIRKRLVETQGDIRIQSNAVIEDWAPLQKQLAAEASVQAVAPYAEGIVMAQHGNRPQFPVIRGIDAQQESAIIPIESFISLGDLADLDDEGLLLGEGLAYSLQAELGSTIEVFSPLMLERLKEDELLLPREFTVVGLFRTGSPQIDGNMMLCSLRALQELYGLRDGVHGYSIKLESGADALRTAQTLQSSQLPQGMRAISWLESNRDLLFVIQQEKRVISFIIIFIILVASFSITTALMMSVMRKTREIGLLVAMGAKPLQVAYSYCFQGLMIGVLGTLLGIGLALWSLQNRAAILAGYARLTRTEVNFLGMYDVYEIPVHYLVDDFILVALFAVITACLAGLLPALRAARLKPAIALRSE